jgi:hypothetical protein
MLDAQQAAQEFDDTANSGCGTTASEYWAEVNAADEELARVAELPVIPETESHVSGWMQSWVTRDVANKKAELAEKELEVQKLKAQSVESQTENTKKSWLKLVNSKDVELDEQMAVMDRQMAVMRFMDKQLEEQPLRMTQAFVTKFSGPVGFGLVVMGSCSILIRTYLSSCSWEYFDGEEPINYFVQDPSCVLEEQLVRVEEFIVSLYSILAILGTAHQIKAEVEVGGSCQIWFIFQLYCMVTIAIVWAYLLHCLDPEFGTSPCFYCDL